MDTFLKANPGLSSRFDKILRFEDYNPTQLLDIAKTMIDQAGANLTPAAEKHLADYLTFLHKYRDNYFGNARSVRQIVDDILRRHDLRMADKQEARANGKISLLKADVSHLKLNTKDLSIQRKRIGF
jgi:hypothetical protein